MREVVLKIKVPNSWVAEVGKSYENAITFIDCMPFDDEGGKGLIKIMSPPEEQDEVIDIIKGHQNVEQIDISPSPDGGIIASVVCRNKCGACKSLMDSSCFLLRASSGTEGYVEWTILAGEEGSLTGLIENLRGHGCEVELKKTTRITKRNILTERQANIIHVAFEKGYYDMPKRITIQELAGHFNVSPSTVAEIIQRGEKKIIWQFLYKV